MNDPSLQQRLKLFFEICEWYLQLARSGVKLYFPQASPEEVNAILKQRLDLHRLEKWKGYGYVPPERDLAAE